MIRDASPKSKAHRGTLDTCDAPRPVPSMSHVFTVGEAGAPRLEAFVRACMPGLSRRLVRALIVEGLVQVNGRPARKGTRLAPGDRVSVPAPGGLAPEPDLPVGIVYEDAALVALDKPGGMPGHALDPRERGTVAAFVLARYPETAAVGAPLAPGLVHRLDTGTSGLVLVARAASDYEALRAAFRAKEVEKRYLAIVAGTLTGCHRIDQPLAHDPSDRRRMRSAVPGERAWRAVTEVEPVRPYGRATFARVTIRTGVTHQIRAHLAALGHPVLGDLVYGGPPVGLMPGHHALHAAGLGLAHPRTGQPLALSAPLPDDFEALLRTLG